MKISCTIHREKAYRTEYLEHYKAGNGNENDGQPYNALISIPGTPTCHNHCFIIEQAEYCEYLERDRCNHWHLQLMGLGKKDDSAGSGDGNYDIIRDRLGAGDEFLSKVGDDGKPKQEQEDVDCSLPNVEAVEFDHFCHNFLETFLR